MLRVITVNVNGIRSAQRKGFFEWLAAEQPDVVCLQEVRADMDTLKEAHFYPEGYYHYFVDADKKGYSGVGIYTKKQPDRIVTKMGWDLADQEARYIQADFGDLSIVSLYFPSGSSSEDPDRGISYAGLTLSCCLVECFGDVGVIEIKGQQIRQAIFCRHP